MTTVQATQRLATIYRTGDSDTKVECEAEKHLWTAVDAANAHAWK
jgi:hypothetical protein